jgi:hypothetical protein
MDSEGLIAQSEQQAGNIQRLICIESVQLNLTA